VAIDHYLRLDRRRRSLVKSGGPRAYLFQPLVNYRTLEFDRPLKRQHVGRIVQRWADYARLGKVTPHDLRRSVVTKLLNDGRSYRDIQMITRHRCAEVITPRAHTGWDEAIKTEVWSPNNWTMVPIDAFGGTKMR
jgi:integrase